MKESIKELIKEYEKDLCNKLRAFARADKLREKRALKAAIAKMMLDGAKLELKKYENN